MGYDYFGPSGIKKVRNFRLLYGSGDNLEQFYYRILYALRNNRSYEVIKKVTDYYNISPNTQQFGFSSSNLRQEIGSTSGLLQQVGQIAKSIVSMEKDKQRIDECLAYYNNKQGVPEETVLKGLWADFVDAKTGPASLTQAAQKLEFFVARDWFFKLKDRAELKKFYDSKDIPANLFTFIDKKFIEYDTWKGQWKPRLERMKEVIDNQLEASKQTINMYKDWLQPLLRNVEALKMTPEPLNPDMIKVGGSIYSMVEIVAWKKINPKEGGLVIFDYEEGKGDDVKKPLGERGKIKYKGKDVPFMPLINIILTLRVGDKGYTETIVDFNAFLMDKKKFEELYWDKWMKDPADEWINNLMLKEGLMKNKVEKKEEKSKDDVLTLLFKKFSSNKKSVKKKRKVNLLTPHQINQLIASASKELSSDLGITYFVVKKSFRMMAEFVMFR